MAKIRLSVGELPLGVEDIEPSVDGSSPHQIATPRESLSVVVPLILWCDTNGYLRDSDLEIPAVDDRIRFSVDNITWNQWGSGITVPGPINTNGRAFFMQARGLPGDTTPFPINIVVDQTGIVQVASPDLPSGVDGPTNDDIVTLGCIRLIGDTIEPVTESDALTIQLTIGGSISPLPDVSETVTEADTLTMLVKISNLSEAVEVVTNSDASSIITKPSSSLTGTYYLRNADRSSGITGDKELGTTATSSPVAVNGNYGARSLFFRCVVLDSSGNVVRTPKAWTRWKDNIAFDTTAMYTSAGFSFTDPAVGATEYFAIQVAVDVAVAAPSLGISPFFTLAQGVNPGPQTLMTVSVGAYADSYGEVESSLVYGGNGAINNSRVVFA